MNKIRQNKMRKKFAVLRAVIPARSGYSRKPISWKLELLARACWGRPKNSWVTGEECNSWRVALFVVGLGIGLLAAIPALRSSPGLPDTATLNSPITQESILPATAHDTLANAAPAEDPWQTIKVHTGDTLSALFARVGLGPAEWLRVMALGAAVETLKLLHPGEQLRLRSDADGKLVGLCYAPDPLHTLVVTSEADALQAQVEELQAITERSTVSGVVNNTLNQALQEAGLSAAQTAEFVEIFHWRVDFRREIRRGTRFSLIYDKRRVEQRELKPGPILGAELVLHDRTLQAFRYGGVDGESGYYDEHGLSLRPTLVRTPVHYSRISSPFSRHRFDPVLKVWRPHLGVDLAANIGTPVRAAGDGRITYLGPNGGYGNLVEITHFGPYATRYAHLRRFASNLHRGSHVQQGEVIGYVGQSGEATGPHLHFEIRVNGTPRNPLTVKLPAGAPLNRRERHKFEDAIHPLLVLLEHGVGGQSQLARSEEVSTSAVQAL